MKEINYKMPQKVPLHMASEPEMLYFVKVKKAAFSTADFNALSKKLLFTQLEWANILHISDRTLQRYLKEGKPFEGLHAEHLYQLENMAALGLAVFATSESFDEWLRKPKMVLGEAIDFSAMHSFWGVKLICNELGRLEYDVYI